MRCYDRDEEAQKLWKQFDLGRNVLMLAPRRVGKTVLLERLKEESASKGYRAIVLDVEGYREERAFFREMCASIQEEIGAGQTLLAAFTERLKRVVQGAEFEGDWRNLLLKVDWAIFADNLIAQLDEDKEGKTWLFLVDEITIFTKALLDGPEGRERASEFLYALRRLCREHPRVRWLYTGSIGLDTLARRHGIEGALVDLEIFELQPFGEATATGFL
ncbi:MAG TPA: AAA-like domain-containing protein, partial [Thermoanaerobaculia bacterium]|nr:AAA-like domain-containing protein [Thermoanaerobaculia bacterium]